MQQHRYILEPYKGPKTRHKCPSCGKKRTFTRYIDTKTGEYISDTVGRCDRENRCNYHYSPSSFFSDNPSCNTVTPGSVETLVTPVTEVMPVEYLAFDLMDRSVNQCRQSNLFVFLKQLFTDSIADQLCRDFFIGSNRSNDTAFWQVDINGNIRQVKVIAYNSDTGKRIHGQTTFAGKKILRKTDSQLTNLQQCFFGEYTLRDSFKPVAIVESEKTAVIASVFYPDCVWLATGGKAGCKWTEANVCKVLKNKKVVLFPDLGAFTNWSDKGRLLASVAGCQVAISDLLERCATSEEKSDGLDIADYLLRNRDTTGLALNEWNYPVIWDS